MWGWVGLLAQEVGHLGCLEEGSQLVVACAPSAAKEETLLCWGPGVLIH